VWEIVPRVSDTYPGSIFNQREDTRDTYFWDSKRGEWSILIEHYDSTNDLWSVVSIDKATDEWYLTHDVPIEIAQWIHLNQ